MLSNPILENPVNLEAAQLFIKDESMYRRVIQKLSQPAPGKNCLQGFPWQLASLHEIFRANN